MRKLVILFLAVCLMMNVIFAQDSRAPNRSISFYLDSFSGDLTKTPDGDQRLFTANEIEIGAIYSQNFASVPWLTLSIKTLFVTSTTPDYGANDRYLGNFHKYEDGFGSPNHFVSYGIPRALIGVGISQGSYFGFLGMDTRGLIANENYYTFDFGDAGALTFVTILEAFAIPLVLAGTDDHLYVLDLFSLRVDYSIVVVENLQFRTKLAVRFNGGPDADGKLTPEMFVESLAIRWENQLVWFVTDKFHMWTQLRYHVDNITKDRNMFEIDNRLAIQAGLGYFFNLL